MEFKGQYIPFGAAVGYIPPEERVKTSKLDPRMRIGIFVGYRLKPGAFWKDEYLVLDLEIFNGVDLSIDAKSFGLITPIIVKTIYFDPKAEVSYPLKTRYDWYNSTASGRAKAT